MKTNDVVFLGFVCAVAALFVFSTLTQTETVSPRAGAVAAGGGGGRPRDVDTDRIRTMIERGELSTHEAEFYREAPAGPESESASPLE
ncbi:MAG: hypothetical protein U9Q79_04720 [Candidatus Hydrogenedentes bacterium]|nr:hypothetical protein [Candidatus Hydrogenedentota bacterium]